MPEASIADNFCYCPPLLKFIPSYNLLRKPNSIMLGELSNGEIEKLLTSNVIGRIGCYANQKMFVVPITYIYDEGYVIGHTIEGLKISILRQNPECCFEVDVMENIANWQSVIAWGTFEELEGEVAERAQKKLIKTLVHLMPSITSQPDRMGPASEKRTLTQGKNPVIYRILLKEKSGRYERP